MQSRVKTRGFKSIFPMIYLFSYSLISLTAYLIWQAIRPRYCILVDWQIRELIKKGAIAGYNPDFINASSLDVRLGKHIEIERGTELVKITMGKEGYHLTPGEFILAETVEVFNLPDNISCEFRLRSSPARMGQGHALAVWIDPGFNNSVLTLELKNYRQNASIHLYPGMRIGQIIFHRHAHCETSYRVKGRYNGDRQVTASKGV